MTLATLHELSDGRIILGIGAYWDSLARNQGIRRRRRLSAMREYVTAVRQLLEMETVNLDDEVVKVEDLRLDLGDRMVREPIDVPIYIGVAGPRMMELAGETAAGVLHIFFTSTICLRQSLEMVERGAARAGRSIQDVDMPRMLAVAMSDDAETVWNIARHDVTMYAGQQPHIGKASGVPDDVIQNVHDAMGDGLQEKEESKTPYPWQGTIPLTCSSPPVPRRCTENVCWNTRTPALPVRCSVL